MASGNKLFGNRIKELREMKKYTQEQLAEAVGLEYQTISRIETGYYFTNYDNLEKFAKALNVEIKDFFDYEHIQNSYELRDSIIKTLESLTTEQLQFIYKTIQNLLML